MEIHIAKNNTQRWSLVLFIDQLRRRISFLSLCLASNLILYCGRRLFCHPSFHFLLHTDVHSFEQASSALLLMCTPINCQLTVETYLDDLRQKIFQRIQPRLYQQKLALLNLILHCQQRIQAIDSFLKTNSIRFVLLTFIA